MDFPSHFCVMGLDKRKKIPPKSTAEGTNIICIYQLDKTDFHEPYFWLFLAERQTLETHNNLRQWMIHTEKMICFRWRYVHCFNYKRKKTFLSRVLLVFRGRLKMNLRLDLFLLLEAKKIWEPLSNAVDYDFTITSWQNGLLRQQCRKRLMSPSEVLLLLRDKWLRKKKTHFQIACLVSLQSNKAILLG